MNPVPGLRVGLRAAAVPPPLPDSNPALVERIRAEIEAAGPMTFARFMDLALYDPDHGYYVGEAAATGRGGDFLTAPEAHPIFGHALARQFDEMWRVLGQPEPFVVREYGAGSGALAVAMLDGLAQDGSGLAEAIRYDAVELNAHRREELVDRLARAGFVGQLVEARQDSAPPIVGCVLANEFIDALPVHRVEQHDGRLQEVFVGWEGGRFVDLVGPPSTPELADRLAAEGVALADGQRAEICLAVEGWADELTAHLAGGFVLVIDYGYPAVELYAPERAGGTIRAYASHQVHDDPYQAVGRQDLTAHVDFTALQRAGEHRGLLTLGLTTQAEFLVGVGTEELVAAVQADPATTLEDYLTLRSSLMRMLDPQAMGRFRVLAMGRDVPDEVVLKGFSFQLPR